MSDRQEITIDEEYLRKPIWMGVALPSPIIIDGNHRFFAHKYLGKERILVDYSGRLDVLRWLQGRRETCPA